MVKTMVKFLFHGALASEERVEEVESRDLSKLDIPKMCYGVQFFDREEKRIQSLKWKRVVKKDGKMSPRYILGGKIVPRSEVELDDKLRTVARNMKMNGWDHVVKTRLGAYIPPQEGDIMVPISKMVEWACN